MAEVLGEGRSARFIMDTYGLRRIVATLPEDYTVFARLPASFPTPKCDIWMMRDERDEAGGVMARQ